MEHRQFAKALRQNMTNAERLLWRHLRAHRLAGQKFRRQQPIGSYVVDFVHFGVRLIVEADGGQHNNSTTTAQMIQRVIDGLRVRVSRSYVSGTMIFCRMPTPYSL